MTGEDAINVEMDPLAELQVREKIAALGMRVVGWYHTHPIFQVGNVKL
jgi:proteasome lid subunit RPN8/RPN11